MGLAVDDDERRAPGAGADERVERRDDGTLALGTHQVDMDAHAYAQARRVDQIDADSHDATAPLAVHDARFNS